jgi:hypothetical protein
MMAPETAASRCPAKYDSKVAESSQICTINRMTINTMAPYQPLVVQALGKRELMHAAIFGMLLILGLALG